MYFNWFSAEVERPLGFDDRRFLDGGQQFDLVDLGISCFGQIDPLGGLLGRLFGCFPRPLGDFDSRSVGFGFGQLRGGQFAVRFGRVAGPRDLLGALKGTACSFSRLV